MVKKETTKTEKIPKTVETKKENKKLTQKEYEKKIQDLAKTGLTAEKIGQKLRDEKIHPKEYSGKISQILGESYVSPDLKNIEKKLEKVKTHFETNKQDKRAKREKDRIFSQLRKLKKYLGINIR